MLFQLFLQADPARQPAPGTSYRVKVAQSFRLELTCRMCITEAESLSDYNLTCNVRLMNVVNTHAEGVVEYCRSDEIYIIGSLV
ncbi:hypothetical protein ACE01N_11650 [Saccharicrinis sp. FJH2]|uniref:hypothetical protein n=1 Tax=Saccharicrinis sp. FJH65 TaxID=3344659 RepID=UPI0035F3E239